MYFNAIRIFTIRFRLCDITQLVLGIYYSYSLLKHKVIFQVCVLNHFRDSIIVKLGPISEGVDIHSCSKVSFQVCVLNHFRDSIIVKLGPISEGVDIHSCSKVSGGLENFSRTRNLLKRNPNQMFSSKFFKSFIIAMFLNIFRWATFAISWVGD